MAERYMSEGSRLISRKRGKDGIVVEEWATGHVLDNDAVDRASEAVTSRAGDRPKPVSEDQ